MREGRRLIAEHVAVLEELAAALRTGRTDAAGPALSRARATQPLVEAWMSSVDSGLAIARVSPIVRRSRFDLERQRVMLARARPRDEEPPHHRASHRVDPARRPLRGPRSPTCTPASPWRSGLLADSLRDVSVQPVARQAFSEIARHLDPVAILPDGPVGDRNTITALRPYLVDLLTSTGLDLDAARALLPAD